MSEMESVEYKELLEDMLSDLQIHQDARNDANLEVTSWLLRGSDNYTSCTCCGGACQTQDD